MEYIPQKDIKSKPSKKAHDFL